MNKFVRNLLTEWRKLGLPFEDETFIVAVSGGADSVGLAVALDDLKKRKKLKLRFVIAHFNHDLRGAESESDAEFVKELAEKLDFEFVLRKGIVSKQGNLEQNARFARYEFLIETARSFQAFGILTAHTINDQAETFLLNLIRGSGTRGLSAMKPVISNFKLQISNPREKSQIQNNKSKIALIRPLLSWATRADTENFCRLNEIEYRQDAMNDDLNFKRVGIRKKLIPVLQEYNPKIIETLARTAALLQNEIENGVETGDQSPFIKDQNLHLKDLKILSKPGLYKTLREWLKLNRGTLRQIDSKHIESIERLVFSRKSGRLVELPAGEAVMKKEGRLVFCRKNIENKG